MKLRIYSSMTPLGRVWILRDFSKPGRYTFHDSWKLAMLNIKYFKEIYE